MFIMTIKITKRSTGHIRPHIKILCWLSLINFCQHLSFTYNANIVTQQKCWPHTDIDNTCISLWFIQIEQFFVDGISFLWNINVQWWILNTHIPASFDTSCQVCFKVPQYCFIGCCERCVRLPKHLIKIRKHLISSEHHHHHHHHPR